MNTRSFFDFMLDEYGLILTDSQIADIFNEANKAMSPKESTCVDARDKSDWKGLANAANEFYANHLKNSLNPEL